MKRFISILLLLSICQSSWGSAPSPTPPPGEAAGYASRDASVMSMMGWGLVIAAGIATLFSLLDNNPAGDGGGGHSH